MFKSILIFYGEKNSKKYWLENMFKSISYSVPVFPEQSSNEGAGGPLIKSHVRSDEESSWHTCSSPL